jgi:hypothetical protein
MVDEVGETPGWCGGGKKSLTVWLNSSVTT